MPIAGGNYLRQLPENMMHTAVSNWIEKESSPFVMYFQVWELDADQPRLSVTSRLAKVRHYRNLGLYRTLLPQYLESAKFTSNVVRRQNRCQVCLCLFERHCCRSLCSGRVES